MKYILILFILLLTSCQNYMYNVTYEKCNGQTGSIISYGNEFNCTGGPEIDNYKTAVPVLKSCFDRVMNVCDFSYTRTEILSNN